MLLPRKECLEHRLVIISLEISGEIHQFIFPYHSKKLLHFKVNIIKDLLIKQEVKKQKSVKPDYEYHFHFSTY